METKVLVEATVSHPDWSNNSILIDIGDTRNIEVKRDEVHYIAKLKIKEESIARSDGIINRQNQRIAGLEAALAKAKSQLPDAIVAMTNWIEQVIDERIQAILRDPNAVALFPPVDTK